MKTAKRLLAFILCAVMLVPVFGVSMITASASDGDSYSGKCGENITWDLDRASGTLVLSGNGAMYDYNESTANGGRVAPWSAVKGDIQKVLFAKEGFSRITRIGDYAFVGCTNLKTIKFPNSLKAIGDHAFKNTSLTGVTIPKDVSSIGNGAFACGQVDPTSGSFKPTVKAIYVDEENETFCSGNGILFSKDMTELVAYPNNSVRTSYMIPNTVTSIRPYAFSGSSKITSVKIARNITKIGKYAFTHCDGLKEVAMFANGLTTIEEGTFSYCMSLNSFVFPKSLTTIESKAFRFCLSLTKLTVFSEFERAESDAFLDCGTAGYVVYEGTREDWDEVIKNSGARCELLTKASVDPEHTERRHVFGDDVRVDATCCEEGYIYKKCGLCNFMDENEDVTVGKLPHNIDKNADATSAYVEVIPATCKADGIIKNHCKGSKTVGCEYVEVTKGEEKRAHNYGHDESVTFTVDGKDIEIDYDHLNFTDGGKFVSYPTCEEDGLKVYTCLNIIGYDDAEMPILHGTEDSEGSSKNCVIPALGHDTITAITKDPTCTKTGTSLTKCIRTIPVLNADGSAVLEVNGEPQFNSCEYSKKDIVPANGHAWSEEVEVVTPATCSEDGLQILTCTVCEYVSTPDDEASVISKHEHEWVLATITAPTCTEEGLGHYVCAHTEEPCACTAIKENSETPLGKIDHDFKIFSVKATCTENGRIYEKCAECGLEQNQKLIPATGHNWNAKITKAPTKKALGEEVRTCINCKKTETTKIAPFTALTAKKSYKFEGQKHDNYVYVYSTSDAKILDFKRDQDETPTEMTTNKTGLVYVSTTRYTVQQNADGSTTLVESGHSVDAYKVSYAWWQWLIVILLFGWIWY